MSTLDDALKEWSHVPAASAEWQNQLLAIWQQLANLLQDDNNQLLESSDLDIDLIAMIHHDLVKVRNIVTTILQHKAALLKVDKRSWQPFIDEMEGLLRNEHKTALFTAKAIKNFLEQVQKTNPADLSAVERYEQILKLPAYYKDFSNQLEDFVEEFTQLVARTPQCSQS